MLNHDSEIICYESTKQPYMTSFIDSTDGGYINK